MGQKKKQRDRSRSDQKKKSKKKSKQQRKQRENKKKKSQKRDRSSSSSQSSDSSSSDRSREKKKKKNNKQKQQKPVITPFSMPPIQPAISPLVAIRPGGLVIPPPAPVTAPVASTKPKTKEYHIFKLLPKLPLGCVNMGRTLYSSRYLQFQTKLLGQMCEQLEKASKAEGSKKMSNMMSRVKTQIASIEVKQKEHKNGLEGEHFENQFDNLKKCFEDSINELKKGYSKIGVKQLKC